MCSVHVGKVLEGTTTITIRRFKFQVTNLNDDRTYIPGKPFKLSVSITDFNHILNNFSITNLVLNHSMPLNQWRLF